MFEFILTISILGNAWQWVINEKQSDTIAIIKQVNKDNAVTVNNFKTSLDECGNKLANWQSQEHTWQVERELSRERLNELERDITDNDWGDCRSRINLEF